MQFPVDMRILITCSVLAVISICPCTGYSTCQETASDGTVIYEACESAANPIIHTSASTGNGMVNITMEPEDATCGLNGAEVYCTLAVIQCYQCDNAVPELAHPLTNTHDLNDLNGQNFNTFWQSKTMDQMFIEQGSQGTPTLEVNITISLGHLFTLQDSLVVKFKSSRPRSMVFEKSSDYGVTWEPWQYFEYSCTELWQDPNIYTMDSISTDTITNVICTQEYREQSPYTGGDVIFDLTERRDLFTSEEELYNAGYAGTPNLKEFYSFTDIRIRLLQPAASGFAQTGTRLNQYYYAISDILIPAGCFCNLHGNYCELDAESNLICNCAHNTMGATCESCLPLFNNQLWAAGRYDPYPTGTPNACQECECHSHAVSCTYIEELNRGRCDICLHNTMGDDCGSCMPNYYKNESVTWHDENACADCNCQPFGVDNGDMTCTDNAGQCNCRMLVTGTKCDRCQDNYYGLLSGTAGSCQPCNCNAFGLISGTQTDPCNYDTGQCICKPRIEGRTCDTCRAGSYLFPHIYNADCTDCGCDPGGSTTFVCDTMSGACECKPGISRRACDLAINGYFVPGIDEHSSQPVENAACTFETSIIIPSQTMYFTDIGYFSCPQEQTLTMEPIDGSTWKSVLRAEYLAVLRYSIENTEIPWAFLTIQVAATGDSNVNMDQYNTGDDDTSLASTCPDRDITQTFDITSLPVGVGLATITLQQNLTIDARCTYGVNLVIGTSGGLPSNILIDSIAYFPNYLYSARYLEANEATRTLYDTCVQQLAALGSRAAAVGRTECQEIIFSIGSQWHDGAIQCECNTQGTLPGTDCTRLGGQCSCKQGVFGRQCDQCEPGYYNFTERGCDPCECSSSGSRLLVCDYETGQCPCLENVALNGVLTTVNTTDNRQCEYCIENYHGHHTGQGCQACNCQETGVTSMQCDDDGVCPCRDLVSGQLCDTCVDGYYGLASIGCSACNCSVAGSLSITCDQANGNCDCKPNVNGEKCDLCDANTFNLREDNPDGCQWCFCYGHSTACTSAPGYQSATVTAADTSVWESVTDESAGTYYKRAPAEFLGNKLTSYGQHLTLTFVPRTQVTVEINNYFPIKLTGNGGQEISYNLSSVTITTSGYQLTAMLHETYWSFDDSTTPTPLQMSAILTSMEMLCVQQRYGDVTFSITDVTLMTTAPVTELAEPEVGFVEVCTCEDDTRGVNCEFCDNGYQRENVDSLNRYENCRACDCRGRAIEGLEICNESTGECLNCRDGTVGFSCESCSANVNVASDCTTCETGFWGISQEGCAACECHPEGAQSTVCDGVTGMCTCQDFVGGRQCDQCVDNYELLTVTGCTECDECYALVGVAVDELRVMRDNITMYVEELRANNSNIALGSFSVRLQSTLDNLDLLLGFLADFSTLHETVGPQMVELNATLLTLRQVLVVSVEVNIFTTNETLLRADGVAMQAQSVYEQTVATTIEAYTLKTGSTAEPCPISEEHCTLHDMVTLMDELVSELGTLQSDIAELSTGAMAEATQIMGYVRDVEDAATQATAITTESQQIMGDTIAVHENNTVRLTALEQYLETVTATETVVVSAAEESRQNATASLQRAVDTLSNATELVATPEENVQSQLTRAVGLIENAQSQATQAGNSYNVTEAAYQTAVTEVVDTNLGLQTAVSELENATVVIEGRAAEAEAMADQARANATDIFIAAQNMVDVLRNFNTRTTEIRAQVTTSLATVEQIRTESLAATATATNIVTELTPSASISDNALEIANETSINAGQQNEDIVAAQTRSNILTATSSSLVTSISEDLAVVEERNDTSVTAAAQSCRALNSNVGILETLTTTSQQRVEEATTRTRTTNNELTRLLGELSLIMQLDPVAIEELRGRIQAAQEDLDERQLQAIAQELQRASVAQRTRINEMQAQKILLESKIQHLRTLQGQLRVG